MKAIDSTDRRRSTAIAIQVLPAAAPSLPRAFLRVFAPSRFKFFAPNRSASATVFRYIFGAALGLPSLLAGPASAQPTTGPAGRSPDVIVQEMSAAQRELGAAIGDPHDLGDPARRAAIAPRAAPPLRRLIADNRELAIATGRQVAVPDFFDVKLRAILAALGDPGATGDLSRMAADPSLSPRGRGGQLLARWLQSPGNADAQGKVVDELAALDAAHPDSDDLARFTGLMTGSAATPALRARLRGLLDPMTSPAAAALRARMAAAQP
jgi:hypothetical protein